MAQLKREEHGGGLSRNYTKASKSRVTLRDRSRMMLNVEKRKNPYAVALGRKGGRKGGPARAAKMTAEQRSESARNAVLARWAKARKQHVEGYS